VLQSNCSCGNMPVYGQLLSNATTSQHHNMLVLMKCLNVPASQGDACRTVPCTHPSTLAPCELCLSHGYPYLLGTCMGESCGRCVPHESRGSFPRSPHTATPEAMISSFTTMHNGIYLKMKICNNQLKSYGQPSPKEFLFSVV
jgi:hypothetical protein